MADMTNGKGGSGTSRWSPLERALRDVVPIDCDSIPVVSGKGFAQRAFPPRNAEPTPTLRQRYRGNTPIGGED